MKVLITLFAAVLLSQVLNAQTTLIPDANFEQALIDRGYDTGTPDGSVPTANISSVDSLDVYNINISDLTGIEDFAALTVLNCDDNQLTSLDLSSNTALTFLNCQQNQLTSLDVSNNPALTFLGCYQNQLTSLDVSNNPALTFLSCFHNQLTSLDVTNNTALTYLAFSDNQLTSLDVSQNTVLLALFCYNNPLTNLDVSNNTALTNLWCNNNQLTNLDVSNNTALTSLECGGNQLTCLNIKNTVLNTSWYPSSFLGNPNLTCIEVDDELWATANLINIDPQTSFSEDCNNPCSSATTGMAEQSLSFNLYPNPVTSSLVVETRYPLQLAIYNIQGKLILDKAISSTYTMDLSELARGIYFLTATDEQGRVYSQKIIKE